MTNDIDVKGTVKRIYTQKTNGWCSGVLMIQGYGEMRFAGTCSTQLADGMQIEAKGCETVHPKYGRQFQLGDITVVTNNRRALIAYLTSSNFPKIGRATASRLYEVYGDDVIAVIRDTPDKVKQDCGFSDSIVQTLHQGVLKNSKENQIRQKFPQLSLLDILKVLKAFPKPIETITEDPYQLMTIDGIGFRTADDVAMNALHLAWDDPRRMTHLLKLCIADFLRSNRSTYVNLSNVSEFYDLKNRVQREMRMLITDDFLSTQLNQMVTDKQLYLDEYKNEYHLYSMDLWRAKQFLLSYVFFRCIQSPSMGTGSVPGMRMKRLSKWLKMKKDNGSFCLNQGQEDALVKAFQERLLFVCGGPGRGKTYWIAELANAWESIHPTGNVFLFAPTGRAVNRLRTGTGRQDAQTIKRFLTSNSHRKSTSEVYFSKSDGKRQTVIRDDSTLIIVDETSMLNFMDTFEFLSLVQGCHIVFVGDKNQLPPIDPGAFLNEMVRSQSVPISYLTENMRTKSLELGRNANRILDGDTKLEYTENFLFLPYEDANAAVDYIISMYQDYLQEGASSEDIMVVCPVNKGIAGVINLNKRLQDVLNPDSGAHTSVTDKKRERRFVYHKGWVIPGIGTKEMSFRLSDRVMCTKNNTEMPWYSYEDNNIDSCRVDEGCGIFNGDIGMIERYYYASGSNDSPEIVIRMDDGRFVFISVENFMDNFTLGYALSVHKSQGCECQHLILSMPAGIPVSGNFLSRNVLYTAVTRAKEDVMIVGSKAVLNTCIQTEQLQQNVTLADELQERIYEFSK